MKASRRAVASAESTMRRQSELIVLIQRCSSAAVEGSTAADSSALLECASWIAVSRSSCSRASSCSSSSFRCVFDTSCDTGLLARLASKPIPNRPNTYARVKYKEWLFSPHLGVLLVLQKAIQFVKYRMI